MAHQEETAHERYPVSVGARGRVVLPSRVRRRLGLREGDRLVLIVQPDDSLRLVSLKGQVERLQGVLKHLAPGRSLVDELIEQRREEAKGEA